jgi:hypothetical protein
LGLQPGSGVPSWYWIVGHIAEEERAEVEAAYREARRRTEPFSWSHRVDAEDGLVGQLGL